MTANIRNSSIVIALDHSCCWSSYTSGNRIIFAASTYITPSSSGKEGGAPRVMAPSKESPRREGVSLAETKFCQQFCERNTSNRSREDSPRTRVETRGNWTISTRMRRVYQRDDCEDTAPELFGQSRIDLFMDHIRCVHIRYIRSYTVYGIHTNVIRNTEQFMSHLTLAVKRRSMSLLEPPAPPQL